MIELMVGVSIGLLVIAVAMGALMVSRSVSGSVSDAIGIQQQGAYAMRILGQQLRQAGSLLIDLNPGNATELVMAPVVLEINALDSSSGFLPNQLPLMIQGSSASAALTTDSRRFTQATFLVPQQSSVISNCAGTPSDSGDRSTSLFQLNGNTLECSGNGATAQPIAQNVANFQINYVQQVGAMSGNPEFKYVASANTEKWEENQWRGVVAAEVCLVLYGTEPIDMPSGSTYRDCDGSEVDMSTITGARARRMHVVLRNVFQLRTQGLVGSVL